MRRLFRAFTLAEVLITLAIIGVVARVTLPALMQNVQEQQVGTILSKAVNTLEVGNQRIMAETGSQSLTGAGLAAGRDEAHPDELNSSQYMFLMNDYMNGTLRQGISLVRNGVTRNNTAAYITKDGILFTFGGDIRVDSEPLPRTQAVEGGGQRTLRRIPRKYHGSYTKLLVDINGVSGPNQLAKDQFLFYIDNFGAVIPYGGAEYERYARNDGTAANGNVPASGTVPRWTNLCAAGQTPENSISARAACTGSIVDNNFQVVYTY